jgi:hypothetical protein
VLSKYIIICIIKQSGYYLLIELNVHYISVAKHLIILPDSPSFSDVEKMRYELTNQKKGDKTAVSIQAKNTCTKSKIG